MIGIHKVRHKFLEFVIARNRARPQDLRATRIVLLDAHRTYIKIVLELTIPRTLISALYCNKKIGSKLFASRHPTTQYSHFRENIWLLDCFFVCLYDGGFCVEHFRQRAIRYMSTCSKFICMQRAHLYEAHVFLWKLVASDLVKIQA